jgi:MFS family permease
MELNQSISRNNFRAFLWHAVFLALATNFMDIDTVIPSMLVNAGGNAFHIGILTAIMLGGASFFQLLFSGFISKYPVKRNFLLSGINLRIFALLALGFLLFYSEHIPGHWIIILIFLFIFIFSVSGAFANVSYVDIIGKSMLQEKRKRFFTLKQVISAIGIFLSAFLVRWILKQYGYPLDYAVLFTGAGILLGIASIGFWKIREIPLTNSNSAGILQLFKSIPAEMKSNRNLRNYIIIINSLGFGISLMPFLIIFAKERLDLSGDIIGNFLLFRVIGMVIIGLIFYRLSKRFIYKHVLLTSIILGGVIPVFALVLFYFPAYFQYLFLLTGVFFTTYKVATDGILIEISEDNNRAFYAGIVGASNLSITIFPLLAGILINILGYNTIFIFTSCIILLSLFFLPYLDCTRKEDNPVVSSPENPVV